MHRVEEFRQADEQEQEIYGDTRAMWERCCVHGLFRQHINMQSLQEQLQSMTGGALLQYEAGDHPQILLVVLTTPFGLRPALSGHHCCEAAWQVLPQSESLCMTSLLHADSELQKAMWDTLRSSLLPKHRGWQPACTAL